MDVGADIMTLSPHCRSFFLTPAQIFLERPAVFGNFLGKYIQERVVLWQNRSRQDGRSGAVQSVVGSANTIAENEVWTEPLCSRSSVALLLESAAHSPRLGRWGGARVVHLLLILSFCCAVV